MCCFVRVVYHLTVVFLKMLKCLNAFCQKVHKKPPFFLQAKIKRLFKSVLEGCCGYSNQTYKIEVFLRVCFRVLLLCWFLFGCVWLARSSSLGFPRSCATSWFVVRNLPRKLWLGVVFKSALSDVLLLVSVFVFFYLSLCRIVRVCYQVLF